MMKSKLYFSAIPKGDVTGQGKFLKVREEQYDFNNELWRVFEYYWKKLTPPYTHTWKWLSWNIKTNRRTYVFSNRRWDHTKVDEGFFVVKTLEKERPWRKPESYGFVKSVKELPPPPKLLQKRFFSMLKRKPERIIKPPEDTLKELKKEYLGE